ncbi:hypothetical protein PPL_11270 [Heterostelium album PN500]|uniref:Uncharacterized protein n=1 Tax=Heterostelium pallidum (strain ATCC 26659 / Pp 5 / PN500) TaxID=670386 RepID=D3BU10_HETP5|nr:hypothetical protein PPL_11270 [Heterostelium album PN500]EFA75196.1 hypothetical protein PPL_11270 [Heterostelium album PN500]|eukprot:XP_020427330.1 hypothetical protein PPL_11270 [Heterostelium album PN500]
MTVATPYFRLTLPNSVHSEDNYGESTKKCKVYDLISFVYLSLQCPSDSKLKSFLRHTLETIQEINHLYIPQQLRHLLNDEFMYEYFDHLPHIKKLVLSDQIFTPKVALSASRFKSLTTIHLTDVDVRESSGEAELNDSNDSILLNTNESKIDCSDLTVSVQSLVSFLDLTPLVESLIMDNLTFVDHITSEPVPLDDNHLQVIGNYILNLKELGLSSFPVDKRGISCMLNRCTSMRRIIMNNCKSITPEILFELQVEYPHISFVCDHTKYSLQSPEMFKYRYD